MRWARALVGALVVVVLAVGCGEDRGDGRIARTRAAGAHGGATDAVPPEVSAAAGEWPLPGRDHANTRAVPDSPITSDTVDDLVEAWRAPLEGVGGVGNAATTPLILGDRIVVQSLDSAVRVFDLDGGLVWETLAEAGPTVGPNGVAVGWGTVFAPKGSRHVFALDLDTGQERWTVEVADTPTSGIDIQPQVVAGLVLVSTVPVSVTAQYTGGDRGVLLALDAETGQEVWRFDTVEDDDLWGNPEINSGGGAWFTPAVDPGAGVVYWGVANPAPFPGTAEFPNASSRPGPNLYTNSVVALDVATGELLWYEQVIPHDLFDRDHVHTMVATTEENPILISTGKGGIVVGHDLSTGSERWRTPVGVHLNDDLEALVGPTEIWPGTFGGVISPPATADGVVYVATLNAPTELAPDTPAYIGSQLGRAPGEVAAIDAATGELLWSTEIDGDPLGGATVVGDLVFTATYQGHIHALARQTGALVWELDAGGGINGWPAVAHDLIVWPVGLGRPAALLALRLSDRGTR